jgi:hypothetical protein
MFARATALVGVIALTALAVACSTQAAEQPTPMPRIVVVTPQPTPAPKPTPEPTPDVRGTWFDSACEAAERLKHAYDDWVQAIDRSDQGDEGDVLDWKNNGRSALRDATDALDALPEWAEGAKFTSAAAALADALSEDFDRIENEPLRDVPRATLDRITGLQSDLFFAGDAASAAGRGLGCGLDQVVS